ncbi:MAG: AtpZ/AtpI family protein [Dehalococcoidia bacterium]|nr:MAG: AtpZ/AtpI family protein [Dehalococcoidia bacterium]
MGKWVLAARLIGIGWYIGISIVGGIWGGIWLDKKLDTSIIFTLVGLFLGLAVAFLGTYRMISPLLKEQQNKEKEDN